ncbi:hypothetical protein A5735_18185 [Mycolicibacter heraklionensis]|nr:hypothetical protein A5735_18185 [Mycolicibacter heraklionensis]
MHTDFADLQSACHIQLHALWSVAADHVHWWRLAMPRPCDVMGDFGVAANHIDSQEVSGLPSTSTAT